MSVDDAARDRTAAASLVVGFVWFVLAHALLNLADKAAGYSSFFAVCLSYALQVWYYCTSRTTPILKAKRSLSVRYGVVLGSATIGVLLLMYLLPAVKVQADILDYRLRKALTQVPLSPSEANKATYTLRIAIDNHVTLPEPTLLKARDAIRSSVAPTQTPPAFWDAADALAQYQQLVEANPENVVRLYEAKVALLSCDEHANKSVQNKVVDKLEAHAAIEECSRSIELSQSYKWGQIQALQTRGIIELTVGEYAAADADAEAAEKLGSLQLSVLFYIRGISLVHDEDPDKLRQGIGYLLMGTHITPTDIVFLPPDRYYATAFMIAAAAYCHLEEYSPCIDNARDALKYVPSSNPLAGDLYKMIIASYLEMGDSDGAAHAGTEFTEKITGRESLRVLWILSKYHSDPKRALSIIWPGFPPPVP